MLDPEVDGRLQQPGIRAWSFHLALFSFPCLPRRTVGGYATALSCIAGTIALSWGVLLPITGVEYAILDGGNSGNVLDASAFPGNVTLIGNGGNDTLRGGKGNDFLTGGDRTRSPDHR